MKHKFTNRFIIGLLALIIGSHCSYIQASSKTDSLTLFGNTRVSKEAQAWYESGSWRNGFTANPFSQTDIQTFYEQYHIAPDMWDSIFTWLASIQPEELPLSKKAMTWSHAYAKVLDQDLRTPENCQWEQHKKTIDLQWDATGSERYLLTRQPELLEAKNEYNEKKDVQNFRFSRAPKADECLILDSQPDTFYLFFPGDYHEACGIAKVPCMPRKIVVKIDLLDDTTHLTSGILPTGQQMVDFAKHYLGCGYSYAATGPTHFDCSGFVYFCCKHYGIDVPHSSGEQAATVGTKIQCDWDSLRPGDIVVFGTTRIQHVGFYVRTEAPNRHVFIHASTSQGVIYNCLESDYWRRRWKYAKRFLPEK